MAVPPINFRPKPPHLWHWRESFHSLVDLTNVPHHSCETVTRLRRSNATITWKDKSASGGTSPCGFQLNPHFQNRVAVPRALSEFRLAGACFVTYDSRSGSCLRTHRDGKQPRHRDRCGTLTVERKSRQETPRSGTIARCSQRRYQAAMEDTPEREATGRRDGNPRGEPSIP